MKSLPFFIILATTWPCFGSENVPEFKLMRQDEDWSRFKQKETTDPLLKIKNIPLGETAHLTFGGEFRERYEYYSNFLWGEPLNEGDGYYLHRLMWHTDVQLSHEFRFFLQLKSNTVSDKKLEPRSIDKDELDLHQAFVDWKRERFTFRLGRQELSYGSSRLVSVREGPSVRQSFDGAKMTFQRQDLDLDIFATRPVETNPGVFDDGSDYQRMFHGIYSTLLKKIDLYWFFLEKENGQYHIGESSENRHTFGARWFSGNKSALDYDFEAALQRGNFGTKNINAWTVASNTGFTWQNAPLRPRLGLKANIASGDRNKGDDSLNTFNALFPKGAYFNQAAIIGPANIMDLHPSFSIRPKEDLTLGVDWDFMWRQSEEDGLYNIPVDPTVPPGSSKEKFIGSQLAATLEWEVSRNLSFLSQYVHFFTGPFLVDTTKGKDIDFYTMWLTFKI